MHIYSPTTATTTTTTTTTEYPHCGTLVSYVVSKFHIKFDTMSQTLCSHYHVPILQLPTFVCLWVNGKLTSHINNWLHNNEA